MLKLDTSNITKGLAVINPLIYNKLVIINSLVQKKMGAHLELPSIGPHVFKSPSLSSIFILPSVCPSNFLILSTQP